MSDSEIKKVSDLRVVDLRAELDKRGLDKNGVKKDLIERLQKALQSEGRDSEALPIEVIEKKPAKRTNTVVDTNDRSDNEKTDGTDSKAEDKNTKEAVEKPTLVEIVEVNPKEGKIENHSEVPNKESSKADNEKVTETVERSDKSEQEQDKTTAKEKVQDQQSTTAETPQVEEKKSEEEKSAASASGAGGEETTQQKKSQSNPKLLWISNVPKNTRANEIKQLLSTCGKVICAKVVVNARFPGSCCFGYVTMGSAEDATNVITKLNNTEFGGHIIKIDKFENIKADTLSPARKKSSEEQKRSNEKKEDKAKKTPENKPTEKAKNDDKATADQNVERRKSLASEQSSRGRIRTRSRERLSKEKNREREREHDRNASHRSDARHRANVLTFDKIKEEREKQRMRDRERSLREESRRRHEEAMRLRDNMRYEADRIQREREKLRLERDKIEKEKSQLLKLEKERQRIEREKLEMEKMELERTRLRLEEDRRAVKRPMPMTYRHDLEEPFDERKRMAPEPERHFERPAPPRFDAPSHGSIVSPKKFGSKDYNKRMHDGFPEKRAPDFNSERIHQGPPINNCSEDNLAKYNRSYDNREPSRDLGGSMRLKDGQYNNNRDRSPQFRQMSNLNRHVSSSGKPERKNFEQTGDRWIQSTNIQSKFGSSSSSSSQNQWGSKGTSTWRMEPPTDRWASSTPSSGRSVGQYSGNNKFGPACPPPPGINSYEYGKPAGGRRY